MGNYSANEGSVRVSLFKPSGKWYTDFAIDMSDYYNEPLIHDAVLKAYGKPVSQGWMLICLDPYHIHSHPVMIVGK